MMKGYVENINDKFTFAHDIPYLLDQRPHSNSSLSEL